MSAKYQLHERIVKCAVAYNGGELQFDRKFLEYMDNFNLIFTENGNTITLKTQIKKDLK